MALETPEHILLCYSFYRAIQTRFILPLISDLDCSVLAYAQMSCHLLQCIWLSLGCSIEDLDLDRSSSCSKEVFYVILDITKFYTTLDIITVHVNFRNCIFLILHVTFYVILVTVSFIAQTLIVSFGSYWWVLVWMF